MLFQLNSFIKFLFKSNNQHGIHSPFVYDLVTHCFYNTSVKKWFEQIELYRNSLLNNSTLILVEDFGAGSKSLSNSKRKVSKIASNAGISKKRGQLLGRMVQYFDSKNILEIGTSLGIATASLRLANPNAKITTLEGCKNTANVAIDSFQKFRLNI